MKFSGLQFEFGKIKIFISSIDTEKASINCSVSIPIDDKRELWIRAHRGMSWGSQVKTSVEAELIDKTNVPPYVEESEPDPDELADYMATDHDESGDDA